MRRLASSPGEGFRLHRELCRVGRRTNRVLANRTIVRCILKGKSVNNGQPNSTNINYYMNELGEKFFEANEKEHILEKHFNGAFNDIESSMDFFPAMGFGNLGILQLLMFFPPIDAQLLRTAVLGFTKGKTSAEDGVVSEMLAALDGEHLTTLADIFRLRTLSRATEAGDPA